MTNKDFVKTWTDSTYYVAAIYEPAELLALNEMNKDNALKTSKFFNEYISRYNKGVYFNVRIGRADGEKLVDENNRLNQAVSEAYFSTKFQNEVYIEGEGKIIKALYYTYNNIYNLKPEAEFLFVFPDNVMEFKSFGLNINCRVLKAFSTVSLSFDPGKLTKKVMIKF